MLKFSVAMEEYFQGLLLCVNNTIVDPLHFLCVHMHDLRLQIKRGASLTYFQKPTNQC